MHIAAHTYYMSALIILVFVTVIHVTLSTDDDYETFSSLLLFFCPAGSSYV
jgi:hypothetical protein